MTTRHKPVLQKIISCLEAWGYQVWHDILNTRDHGVPHNRPRLYLVAIRADSLRHGFEFPAKIALARRAKNIVAKAPADSSKNLPVHAREKGLVLKAYEKLKHKGTNPRITPVLIDVHCSEHYATFGIATLPCLTATRGSACGKGHWCSTVGRHLNLMELFQFQGFGLDEASKVMSAIQSGSPTERPSSREVGKMLGNAMSLNVVERVLVKALLAAGLARNLTDRWA